MTEKMTSHRPFECELSSKLNTLYKKPFHAHPSISYRSKVAETITTIRVVDDDDFGADEKTSRTVVLCE